MMYMNKSAGYYMVDKKQYDNLTKILLLNRYNELAAY